MPATYHINDLWALDLTQSDPKPRAVANTPFDEKMGQFSPNGRWVAYTSNESGQSQIVVQPFPNPISQRAQECQQLFFLGRGQKPVA